MGVASRYVGESPDALHEWLKKAQARQTAQVIESLVSRHNSHQRRVGLNMRLRTLGGAILRTSGKRKRAEATRHAWTDATRDAAP